MGSLRTNLHVNEIKDRILNVILDKCSTMSYILSDVEADRHMQFRYIVEGSYNVGDDNL